MMTDFKNVYASCVSIPTNIRETSASVIAVLNEFGDIGTVQNFPEIKNKLLQNLAALKTACSDAAISALTMLGESITKYADDVLFNFVELNYPITAEGLAKCSGALPTDTLHQWSYLNPHLYATMMYDFADKGFEIAAYVDPRSCCMIAPEDMYVVSILKRTYGYISEIKEDPEMNGWLFAAFSIVHSFADYLRETIAPQIDSIYAYYDAESFDTDATAAINLPNVAEKIKRDTDGMINILGEINAFASRLEGVMRMTNETADILEESQVAIMEAYRIYCEEAFKITF